MSTYAKNAKLYRDFTEIDLGAPHTLVRFYEANETGIAALSFENYFEILVNYSNALFEIGAYAKHIKEVDKIIYLSIEQNIRFFGGEDVYFKSLFQKAASLFNLHEIERAEHILRELIKMDPYNQLSIRFLKKCLFRYRPRFVKRGRAFSIVLFLTATLVTAIEVMFIYPFLSEWGSFFEYLRWGIFGLGLVLLGGNFLLHYFRVNKAVNSFALHARAGK